jgi:NAD(P)-dependent dehydrogenase (short-subunit alcohol dehydrogenase family)
VLAGIKRERYLSPMTIALTGGTSGIGKAAARAFVKEGHHLVLFSRSVERGESTARELGGSIEVVECDLASLASVRRAAAEFARRHETLDVLVNNAGLFTLSRYESEDGYELQFAVNHLGHFLLANLLLDQLYAADAARVVVVSSNAHHKGTIHFADLQLEKSYGGMQAYAQSKIANILFVRELASRTEQSSITANALHPGAVSTNIASARRGSQSLLRRILQTIASPFLRTPEQGAETLIYLATSPEVSGLTGRYYDDKEPVEPSDDARDDAAASRLWAESCRLVSLDRGLCE